MKIVKILIILIFFILIVACILYLFFPHRTDYDEEWIVGKTRQEIEDRYGSFDEYNEYHNYHNKFTDEYYDYSVGIYHTSLDKPSLFGGTIFGRNLEIYFDENGIATSVSSVSTHPGG